MDGAGYLSAHGWLVGCSGFKVVIITNLEQKQKSA